LEEIEQVLPINTLDDWNELQLAHLIHNAIWLKLFCARQAIIPSRNHRPLVPRQILPGSSETGIVDVIFHWKECLDSMVIPEDHRVNESFVSLLVAERCQLSF
jgi:hypothetical protein